MNRKLYITLIAVILTFAFQYNARAVSYDFRDGTIITNGQSDDGSLVLSGTYSHHDETYGLNMKSGSAIAISVEGSCTLKFLGSAYSSLSIEGTAVEAGDLGNQNTQVENDLSDTYDFVYDGPAATLTFTATGDGSDVYLPLIDVVFAQNETEAKAGETYIYNFADGSELPQTGYTSLRYATFVTSDGILTLNSNTDEESMQFGYHDSSHGAVLFPGNSMEILVAGNATITFGSCQYGNADDAIFEFTDANGTVLGQTGAQNIGSGSCGTNSFSYVGGAGLISATLKSEAHASAEVYIHGVTIENAPEVVSGNGKTDVWDFGAEQLDEEEYNNQLNEEAINAWYDESVEVGSAGNTLPNLSAGMLSWVGGGNDRLRTSNTNLTRYDENLSGVSAYTGRIYVNSSANSGRYMSLTLSEDDEVTIFALSQNGGGQLNFQFVGDPAAQTDVASILSDLTEVNFVAKYDGTYHIFDTMDKPSYYRIYRKDAQYKTISGTVDVSSAEGIPDGYAIQFTNEAGKTWQSEVSSGNYSVSVPAGYAYNLSLKDANGYVISNGATLNVEGEDMNHEMIIQKVELYSVSGSVSGLGDQLSNLTLVYTADPSLNKIFVPEPVIDSSAGTYSVQLEPNCEYSISAIGVNDFYLPDNTITIEAADQAANIVFEAKPLYDVTITAEGLSPEQLAKMQLTFTNLNEDGYVYSFESVDDIALRDGVYSIEYSGLDDYAVHLGLTSNLEVVGANVSKTLVFSPIKKWSFDDKAIAGGATAYSGLVFTGNVSNEVAKGHLSAKPEATIQVPVNVGDKIRVSYYYSADFSIEGNSYSTSSGSTSTIEYAEYTYTGTEAGFVTITIGDGAGTSYIIEILITDAVAFAEVLYVGEDKDYQTVNGALDALREMIRPNNERVTIMIDPGNYEEMLVVDVPNITLKNAAVNPGIGLTDKGVNIEDNAVRITSYYGHGYNYYSMGDNQKWDAEVLRVNKENGYLSYENAGSGSTNGSYWNATVVISANGFEAYHIIFENSFNQYISKKESEDVVVMWDSGSKGERPTEYGNSDVQQRTYVERAAAIATLSDKVLLYKCRVVGRQDSFYGAAGRVVIYKGAAMGAVDYLFGAMTAVFYKTDLVMNVSDASNDASYLTAAQQSSGRGYLMYECKVTSAEPGVETASQYLAKPGYFGRPWQATTSEVVFYNTTIDGTNYPGSEGKSMIAPMGWNSSLGGESPKMYEFGTNELSNEDNRALRASWATLLSEPTLIDGTEITTFNFTKGSDSWDPIPELVANDNETGIDFVQAQTDVHVFTHNRKLMVQNVKGNTCIDLYSINGTMMKSVLVNTNCEFEVSPGLWIVHVKASDGQKAVKLSVQ
ncbi:MAG: pectinesterase family protein [Prolixibacteraceae bacterium]|jgi:pectin methylesterase-like acyl-CoA thioesterase|nr:pectinesterase family protein [Prolixibacteraceae bacterium]